MHGIPLSLYALWPIGMANGLAENENIPRCICVPMKHEVLPPELEY